MVFERRLVLWTEDSGVLRPVDADMSVDVGADIVATTMTVSGESVVEQGVANRHEVRDVGGLKLKSPNEQKWSIQVSNTGQISAAPTT